MIAGSSSVRVAMGKDSSGYAYVQIFGTTNYAAISVLDVTGGYSAAAWDDGWVITRNAGEENKAFDTTLYPPLAANKAYIHPATAGNKHIPAGGVSGQILRWSADGTAAWGADNNTTHGVVTTAANGLMSAADKTKLDGVAAGANKYTLPAATASALGGVKVTTGNGLNNASGTISMAAASQSAAGAMSAADKTKLDGVAEGSSFIPPVGFMYIQFPGTPTPDQLWGNTSLQWENVSARFPGAFFRAEGSLASAFNASSTSPAFAAGDSGTTGGQSSGAPNITGAFKHGKWGSGTSSGAFYASGSASQSEYGASSTYQGDSKSLFDASRSSTVYGSSPSEVRPKNITIRVWRRKA